MIPIETIQAIFTSPLGTQAAAEEFGVAMSTVNKIRDRKIRRSATEGLKRCPPLDRQTGRHRNYTLREAEEIRQLHSHGIYNCLELIQLYGGRESAMYALLRGALYKVPRQ